MAKIRRSLKDLIVKQSNGLVRHEFVCLECKKDFISSRTTAKFCSDKCKQANYYYRKAKKEYEDRLLR